jgi:predicted ABC-type ATPase
LTQLFLLVIAGPNGAGKTTLISYLLRHNVDFGMFISPDEIAPGHCGRQPSGAIFFGVCMLAHSCQSSISSDRCSEVRRATPFGE